MRKAAADSSRLRQACSVPGNGQPGKEGAGYIVVHFLTLHQCLDISIKNIRHIKKVTAMKKYTHALQN